MSKYEIVIPGWNPTLDNVLMRHRMGAHSRKKRDAATLGKAAHFASVPRVGVPLFEKRQRQVLNLGPMEDDPKPIKRRVWLKVSNNWVRKPDPTAYWKSLLDALVVNGLLVDDNERWSEITPPVFSKGSKLTIVTLEDLPDVL